VLASQKTEIRKPADERMNVSGKGIVVSRTTRCADGLYAANRVLGLGTMSRMPAQFFQNQRTHIPEGCRFSSSGLGNAEHGVGQ